VLVVVRIAKKGYTKHQDVYVFRPKYLIDTVHLSKQIVKREFSGGAIFLLRSKLCTAQNG
jgi:hypothetical protein